MTVAVTAPFPESKEYDLDGLCYAYLDEGSGPPVVMVHGNPSWSYLFRDLIEPLTAEGFRILAPDHIGMGRSAKPSRAAYEHTMSQRVADFTRWMAQCIPAGPVRLVVHDWGGAIALAWAVEHPERVVALVLLNTAAFPLPGGKRLPLALTAARLPLIGDLAVRRGNAFARGATVLGVHRRMRAATRRAFLAPYDSPAARTAVLEFVRDVPARPTDAAYPLLARTESRLPVLRDRPVLICWGMRDFVLNGDILAHWESILPSARVHRFPDAGHYVLEDAGAEIVPLVVEFLAGPASVSSAAAPPAPTRP